MPNRFGGDFRRHYTLRHTQQTKFVLRIMVCLISVHSIFDSLWALMSGGVIKANETAAYFLTACVFIVDRGDSNLGTLFGDLYNSE